MEFETKFDKIAFFIMILLMLVVVGYFIYSIHAIESRSDDKHAAQKKACENLNVKFGQSVRVKEGFYKDVEFIAVDKGEETVELQYLKGLQLENARFLCSDVEVK